MKLDFWEILKYHVIKLGGVYPAGLLIWIGGENMATSSIIENIRVNNPKVLEEYVDAMEARGKSHRPRTENEKSGVVTDSERTKKFMAKVLAKKGIEA